MLSCHTLEQFNFQVEDKPADKTNKVSDDDEDSTEAAFDIVAKNSNWCVWRRKAKKKKKNSLT